jgi:hypothetical protein
MSQLRAGSISQVTRGSGSWAFIDIGFASNKASCGFALDESPPTLLTFANLKNRVVQLAQESENTLNLVIEAPLSVAFSISGNPVGRSVEKRGGTARYWYFGLGCGVLVAATYLLRALNDAPRRRDVFLFEGLVSFKPKGVRSSHTADVEALRAVAWRLPEGRGRVIAPEALRVQPSDHLQSAFTVAGFDLGIPPVVAVEA